jgi:mono/diheme cytochrome c family protein
VLRLLGSKRAVLLLASAVSLATTGCGSGPKSARGFRLPDGDANKGKAAFVALRCTTCHKVTGVELPAPAPSVKAPMVLGGEVTRLRTYGDLVTSIIHPSHRMSAQARKTWASEGKMSAMPEFNEMMTVSQMVDLVAFLQPRYKRLEVSHPDFP